MKNFIIVILIVIVVALSAYVYSLQGNNDALTTFVNKAKSNLTESIEKIEDKVQEVSNSVVSSETSEVSKDLPDDTVISINLPFSSIKPAIDHIFNTANKIRDSSVAKKLQLDQMLEQSVQSEVSEKAPSFDEMIKVVQEISAVNLLLRAKVLEGRSAPMLSVSARFNSDYLHSQIKQSLDQATQEINSQLPNSIKNNPSDPDIYNVEVKGPGLPVEIVGTVTNKSQELSIKLAALTDSTSNQPPDNAEQLEAKSVLDSSLLSKNAMFTYWNAANFAFLQESITDSLSSKENDSESKAVFEMFKSLLKDYKSVASSAEFNNGFNSRSCALMHNNSRNLELAKKALSNRSGSSVNLMQLITSRTTFAANFKISSFTTYLQGLIPEENSKISLDAQAKEANDKINLTVDRLDDLGLRDIGVIANSPVTSFMPDYAVYIEHSGKYKFKDLVARINELVSQLAPPSLGLDQALTVSENASGQEQVVVNISGYPLTFSTLNDNIIIGSGQPAFSNELSSLLTANGNYLSATRLKEKNIKIDSSKNDYQIFISPASLTAFARQFLPFLTMMVPDLKISDAEVNEVLEMFNFNVLLTSSSSMPEKNMLCSEGQAVLF